MADKRSHATDPATLRAIPAVNGTRVGGTRKPRTRTKALSDCITYNANDPTNAHVFAPLRKRHKQRTHPTVVRDTRPEVLRMASIVGNIGNVE